MSTINYLPGIPLLPESWEKVLRDTLDSVGISSLTLSSTFRTPAAQALAMYNNVQTQGIDAERNLYGPYGNKVLDEYQLKKNYGYGKNDILKGMEQKIIEIGPQNVSAHCTLDPLKNLAFDIPPGQIPDALKSNFETAMKRNTSKFLIPGITTGEPVYHAEINESIFATITKAAANPAAVLVLAALGAVAYFIFNKK